MLLPPSRTVQQLHPSGTARLKNRCRTWMNCWTTNLQALTSRFTTTH